MKLIIAIVQDEDSRELLTALNRKQLRATKLASTGGFLRIGNTTVIIGCKDEEVESALEVIKEHAKTRKTISVANPYTVEEVHASLPHPIEVMSGGATVFVLPVDGYFKF